MCRRRVHSRCSECLWRCIADNRGVGSLAFSPDGTRIVTASDDNTARIWRIFPTTRALVDYARSVMPRELTGDHRVEFF